MAKEQRKKVKVQWLNRDFQNELYEDIAKIYEGRGKLKILGGASAPAKDPEPSKEPEPAKDSGKK